VVTPEQRVDPLNDNAKVNINFPDTDLFTLVKYFANLMQMDFIIADVKELQGKKVYIVSHGDGWLHHHHRRPHQQGHQE